MRQQAHQPDAVPVRRFRLYLSVWAGMAQVMATLRRCSVAFGSQPDMLHFVSAYHAVDNASKITRANQPSAQALEPPERAPKPTKRRRQLATLREAQTAPPKRRRTAARRPERALAPRQAPYEQIRAPSQPTAPLVTRSDFCRCL